MGSLKQLTHPFQIINYNTSQNVKDKFLEGQPFKNKNFPGPFQGMTEAGQNNYMQVQNDAVQDYDLIAERPLHSQVKKYPTFNSGEPDCANYFNNQVPMVAPTPPTSRQANYPYPYLAGSSVREQQHLQPKKGIEEFKDINLTDPQNETGFGKITPQFMFNPGGQTKCQATGNPLLDITNRPNDQFSHNNMVPFYGAKLTQNMANTGVPQAGSNNICGDNTTGFANVTPNRGTLELYTGSDEMYMHKRETPVMFSPVEGLTGWVYGTPAIRPDLDRYKQDIKIKNNESPVEKLRVGPGIATDYSVPAVGGFQQYTRILPNNISDYKANQLEGRVNAGKWMVSHPTSQFIHGVKSNKPSVYMTQARRPTMRTKFYANAPGGDSARVTDYNTLVNRGKQGRSETEVSGGFGQFNQNKLNDGALPCVEFGKAPVGKTMKSIVPMPSQDLQSYNTIRETFRNVAAGYDQAKGGYWQCNDEEPGSNRWDLWGPATGGVPNQGPREGIYMNYTDRGDINPYVINATGTAQVGGQWSPNSYQDQQRVTRRETTAYGYNGNAKGSVNNSTTPFQDDLRVTRKETNAFAYQGNARGSVNNHTNSYPDEARVTRKETNSYAYQGNARGSTNNFSDRQMYLGTVF